MDNFLEQLRDLIVDEIQQKRAKAKAVNGVNGVGAKQTGNGTSASKDDVSNDRNGTIHCDQSDHFDSGIDTSDSCDEKKIKPQLPVKAVKRQHSKSLTAS